MGSTLCSLLTMLIRPATNLCGLFILGTSLSPPGESSAGWPTAAAHNHPHAPEGRCSPCTAGAQGPKQAGPWRRRVGSSAYPRGPSYLQTSPSAPLSGISRHSSLSMAHCCPAAQHVSIRSFVETVGGNTGRVTTLEEGYSS